MLGYTKPLYILAFDHRNTFSEHLYKIPFEALTYEQTSEIVDFKRVIYAGFKAAVAKGIPHEAAGILVDEQFGDGVLRDATIDKFVTILTVEKSGQKVFELEYGDMFGDHIMRFKPTFTKVLIHYNPEDPEDTRKQQQERLKTVCDYTHQQGFKFLLEVLIGATEKQLADAGSKEAYDVNVRPDLTKQVIVELQNAGVEPDIWKLEGLDSVEHYTMIVEQARSGGRSDVSVVVLGRGATEEKVNEWLRLGAQVSGVIGFAVGRTIFWDNLVGYHEKRLTRDEAIESIAEEFFKFYKVFSEAKK
jgi:5-dehydro-2-deoxygluconokinase